MPNLMEIIDGMSVFKMLYDFAALPWWRKNAVYILFIFFRTIYRLSIRWNLLLNICQLMGEKSCDYESCSIE